MAINVEFARRVNVELLHQELRAALGAVSDGVRYSDDDETGAAILLDGATASDVTTAENVIAAHDANALSATQTALLATADADVRAREIPGWATWDEQQAIDYITTEVTDLASAKVVLVAMARIIVALRDAQWPALSVE